MISFFNIFCAGDSIEHPVENTIDPIEGIDYELIDTEFGWIWEGLGEYSDLDAPCYFDDFDQAEHSAQIAIITFVAYS